ncbi:N/A [soil metagenome]
MSHPDRPLMLKNLNKVERLAKASKIVRLMNGPGRYFTAQGHKWLVYRYTKKGMLTSARTFFGIPLQIVLPSATDIYLTGSKTHPSEIRLARYMVNHLQDGERYLDVGAHFGFFTSLAACLVGSVGGVLAIEASPETFKLLKKNTTDRKQVKALNIAITNRHEEVTFHEFPVLLSEYNSLIGKQYEKETWYSTNKPKLVKVQGYDLNRLLEEEQFHPTLIKIDVEGAEDKVIQGGLAYFKQHRPVIVMEYLADRNKNTGHQKAVDMLKELGYSVNVFNPLGEPEPCDNILAHLEQTGWESDNVVLIG